MTEKKMTAEEWMEARKEQEEITKIYMNLPREEQLKALGMVKGLQLAQISREKKASA